MPRNETQAMKQMVESVMNVSEGRDAEKLNAIAGQIKGVPDAFLLDCDADPDHHRSVFSFVGTPSSILEAAWAGVRESVRLIDLRRHRGVHPRIGAVDVLPLVPLRGVSMAQCVAIAHQLGHRIAEQLRIPIYFYGEAALNPRNRELSTIRQGQFEGLAEETQQGNSARRPDCGPLRPHPSAGATAVGARAPLIAFNIYLDTTDLELAKAIAGLVREKGGGLPGIQALGFYLPQRGQAQVSLNVTDYHKTSLLQIFQQVSQEAKRLHTEVISSQIVGLVPQEALAQGAVEALKLESFDPSRILENSIATALARSSYTGS